MFLSSIRPTDYDPLELFCILWDGKMRTERMGVGDHVAVERGRFSGLVLVTKLWMRLDGLFVCEVDSRVTPNNGSIVEPVVG